MSLSVTAAALLGGAIQAGATGISGLIEKRSQEKTQGMKDDLADRQRRLEQSQYDFNKRLGSATRKENMAYQEVQNRQKIEDVQEQGRETKMGVLQGGLSRTMGERTDMLRSAQEQAQRRGGQLG